MFMNTGSSKRKSDGSDALNTVKQIDCSADNAHYRCCQHRSSFFVCGRLLIMIAIYH